MKNHNLSEEFKRMQKLAGLLNENQNWEQLLNEVEEYTLSKFPLGIFTKKLMELVKNNYKIKYHDSGVNYDTFDLNAINFNLENDQLHVSFSKTIEDKVEPLIMDFFQSESEALKQYQQKRNPKFIGKFDDVIVYPSGPNFGKKIITLKFDY